MTTTKNRRLRAGIVGGGRGAFIGAVHRIAAQIDGEAVNWSRERCRRTRRLREIERRGLVPAARVRVVRVEMARRERGARTASTS